MVGDLALVVCPPYDLITPELQESLRRLSPYNVVHLEAGEGLDLNDPAEGQYRRTAEVFKEWQGAGVLRRDPGPFFYLLRHTFPFQGKTRDRLGLTACVGLEPYRRKRVFPHEFTQEPAILDRVSLMEKCRANFSPIMALYRDSKRSLAPVFAEAMTALPDVQVHAGGGQELTMWRISDRRPQDRVRRFFAGTPVFLADGHHRYEAALRLQQKRRGQAGNGGGRDAASNFVMMTLIEFDDPGLLVLPYHRVMGGLPPTRMAQLEARLRQLFDDVEQFLPIDPHSSEDPSAAVVRARESLLERVVWQGQFGKALARVRPRGDACLLRLRDEVDWRQWGPLAASEAWILEEQVLKPVLGQSLADHVTYVHDLALALEQVFSGHSQMAFLFQPFPMAQFEPIVRKGQRLPPKSTFFYPKLPTGLVINELEGTL